MKIPAGMSVYGNTKYRNKKCPKESLEQITFVNNIRVLYPETYGRILVHAKNEGKLINGQFSEINKDRAMGMAIGCPDIFIPGLPSFCMELKRADHTLSKISDDQIEYLLAAKECGSFVCVALGHEAAMEAFNYWIKLLTPVTDSF